MLLANAPTILVNFAGSAHGVLSLEAMARILLILTTALVFTVATAGQTSQSPETLQDAGGLSVVLEHFDRGKFQLKVIKHARDAKGESYLVAYNVIGHISKG